MYLYHEEVKKQFTNGCMFEHKIFRINPPDAIALIL